MSDSIKVKWIIIRSGLRWRVVKVTDCGVIEGVPTRPFYCHERSFWRFDLAKQYIVSRVELGLSDIDVIY